jgi:hypothetical protein
VICSSSQLYIMALHLLRRFGLLAPISSASRNEAAEAGLSSSLRSTLTLLYGRAVPPSPEGAPAQIELRMRCYPELLEMGWHCGEQGFESIDWVDAPRWMHQRVQVHHPHVTLYLSTVFALFL